MGAYRTQYNRDVDSWLVKINPSGSAITFSTFISMRSPNALTFTADSNIVLTGSSASTPVGGKTFGVPTGTSNQHATVLKMSSTGSQQLAAAFIGGNDYDIPNDLVLNADGGITLAGYTYSSDFPITADAADKTPPTTSSPDIFVAVLNADFTALQYATFLGGDSDNRANALASSGADVWVVGTTGGDVAATTYEYAPAGGGSEAFVAKLTGLAQPTTTFLSSNGVVNGGSFLPEIASGAWLTIFGGNLAATSRSWGSSDFSGTRLPTALDGTSVKVNGKDAVIAYVSPGQINALVPSMDFDGDTTVTVTSSKGTAQTAVRLRRYSLGFFTYPYQNRKYVAAVHPDGALVGNRAVGGSARPVLAGGRASLYGTGWGPTTPAQPENLNFTGAYSLVNAASLRLTIGGVQVAVEFAGAVSPGLYQFNIVAPNLPAGDYLVSAQFAGSTSQSDLYITIQ